MPGQARAPVRHSILVADSPIRPRLLKPPSAPIPAVGGRASGRRSGVRKAPILVVPGHARAAFIERSRSISPLLYIFLSERGQPELLETHAQSGIKGRQLQFVTPTSRRLID